MNNEELVRMTISVIRGELDSLKRISKIKKVSVSWVIREAISQYLNRELK